MATYLFMPGLGLGVTGQDLVVAVLNDVELAHVGAARTVPPPGTIPVLGELDLRVHVAY